MTVSASLIEHVFLGILALNVSMECALTIAQARAAESTVEHIPPGFENKLSLAAIHKAGDYSSELAQSKLILTFLGAAFALLMTYGNGLSVLISLCGSLTDSALPAQWLCIALISLLMVLVEFPFGWYAKFRVRERFGYMRMPRRRWILRTLRETLTGWLLQLPLLAAVLGAFELCGRRWWLLAWGLWCLYLAWRWGWSRTRALFWARRQRDYGDPVFAERVAALLARAGLELEKISVMTRPVSWAHSHVALIGRGKKRHVVIFAHAGKLDHDALLALIAHDLGHERHYHIQIRLAVYALLGLAVCAFAGWGATHAVFFEGFGVSRFLTFDTPGTHAGYVTAVALVTFPILFYPLRPLINGISRLMQYDADRYGARLTGPDALIRAIVQLHRDYSTTLTPSTLYSLFHYRRPHVGMRVKHLIRVGASAPVSESARPTPDAAADDHPPSV